MVVGYIVFIAIPEYFRWGFNDEWSGCPTYFKGALKWNSYLVVVILCFQQYSSTDDMIS